MGDGDADRELAQQLYERWQAGESKSRLEIEVWGDATSHGRKFDRFLLTHLGVSTSRPSRQSDTITELRRQVRQLGAIPYGHDPEPWEVQLQHAREACMAALRVWNDPTARARVSAFSLLFVAAWNGVALAKLMRDGGEWRQRDRAGDPVVEDGVELTADTCSLARAAFPAASVKDRARLANIEFWVELRNCVAHRHIPGLEMPVIPQAQAGLINIEEILTTEFGAEYSLAEWLHVPLQLSGFRDPDVLASRRRMQAALPIDVQLLLAKAETLEPDLAADPAYQLRVAFLPVVPASGRNPDAVAFFAKPGEVPSELAENLDRYLVISKSIRPTTWFTAAEASAEVQRRTGYRFTSAPHHSTAVRRLGAKPSAGEPDRTVDITLAEYVSSFKRYQYTQKWIDLLVQECGSPEGFERTTGRPAVAAPLPVSETHE
jgi:hypothetical protein